MSRLVTQLVAEEPAVVLLGEDTILRKTVASVLNDQNVLVEFLSASTLSQNITKLQNAYKIVWICDREKKSEEYAEGFQYLSQFSSKVLLVVPIFTGVNSCQSDMLQRWVIDTQKQEQFIVDCNYYLQSSSFLFGENIIGNNNDISIFNYLFNTIQKNILVDPLIDISFISLDDFVTQIASLIFVPKKQVSSLITGKAVNSISFISLVKKLYDAYHNTNLEIVQDKISKSQSIPFSVQEKQIQTDIRTIATYLVKKLPAPTKKEEVSVKVPFPQPVLETVPIQKQTFTEEIPINLITPEPIGVQQVESKSQQQPAVEPEIKPALEEVDLNKEIQRIFKDTRTEQKVERVEKIVKSTKTITKKSKRKTKLFYGGLLAIGMAVGMIVLAFTYLVSGSILKKQIISFLTETATTQSLATSPGVSLIKTADFVNSQTELYSQIIELAVIAQNSVLVNLTKGFVELPEVLLRADEASKNLVINILTGTIGNTGELTEILTQSVSEAYEKLSLIQATLEQIDLGENSEKQQTVIEQIGKEIQDIRYGLEIHQELQQILPEMVGIHEKRTYALLLQNNQELRPTGGFIQAIALLNFDKGSLVSYQVYSVYELDKKLPGQVVPPDEIKLHLGETNWFLRDSNWDPDFSRTSKQVTWFLEKALGVQVDGVISLNVFSLEDLLKAVGPIDLPEYNEVITDKNIEERMEFHSEVVLVDSPEAVDYSVKILSETLAALSALKEENVQTLLSGLNNSLETKQTQIYSRFESEQSILQTLGWAGVLTQPSCPSRLSVVDCLVDTMTQVEANIGINKANYYLERSINHKISVSKTEAQHVRTIVFNNKAQSNSWPKGTYKTYLRFYVNSNSKIEKVLINGSELTINQIFQTQENGFDVVGVRVDVPIQKQITVELVYSTPLSTNEAFSYVFYNRKQSGLDDDPFSVSITHTPDIKPVLIAPSATISGNTITFSTLSLDDASLFGVQFE